MATPISAVQDFGPASKALMEAALTLGLRGEKPDEVLVTAFVKVEGRRSSSRQEVSVPGDKVRPLVIELLKNSTVTGIEVHGGPLRGSLGSIV